MLRRKLAWFSHACVVSATVFLTMSFGTASAADKPAWPEAPKAPAGAPNIVLILLDDVGYGAASTFGGPAQTPALDQLAAQGLRYNRFHVTALCSPTRAALLTGRNHHRTSFGTVAEIGTSDRGYNAFWPRSVATLSEILKANGYSTAAIGKWHNTPQWETSPVGPFDRWPTGLGFEYFYGFQGGETSQWEPILFRDTTPVEPGKTASEGYNLNVDLVDDATRWVHTHESIAPDKPYFLYFAPGATHSPHHVPQQWVDKYKGRFDQGWDKVREEIFARQKKLGVIPAAAELTPRPAAFAAWDSLSADQKRLYARQMEVAAAYLEQTDYEVGRLLNNLRQGPHADNTLVLYIVGDNGASAEGGLNGSDNELQDILYGLENGVERQLRNIDKLGGSEMHNHYAAAWAWAMDTPFQWTKQVASYFGGTRDPLIVSWPARIKDVGGLRDQFTHVNDIAPTIYDLLGIKFPKEVDGVKQEPIDGFSFAKSFGDARAPSLHRVQYFEQFGNRAIYQDGWVAAAFHGTPLGHAIPEDQQKVPDFDKDRWELYNIERDFSEAHDLAKQEPARLNALKKLYDVEARKNYVFPMMADFGTAINNFISSSRPSLTGNRKEFQYAGTMPRMPSKAAPQLLNSHRITASIEVPASGASGVIVANGDREGGFALYAKDGRLVYEQNFLGRERYVITSTAPLPAGHVDVRFDFERQDKEKFGGGIGRLSINGQPAGEGVITHVGLPFGYGNFTIGTDGGPPVSNAYTTPAPFNGTVNEVGITRE